MARTKDFDENEVLQKAIQLFAHKGYAATSMQDLVDTLCISRSSLYDTFGDKRQLYVKALQTYQQQNIVQLESLVHTSPSVKDAIQCFLEMLAGDLLNDCQQKGCFMTNAGMELAAHDQEINTLVCNSEQQIEQALLQAITKGQQSGEISKEQSALSLARFLSNTIKGFQVAAKSNRDPAFFEDIIRVAVSTLQ